jgi:hypothetical protein
MKPKRYTLTMNFETLEDAVAFSEAIMPTGVALYHADVLDREFGGQSVPVGSLVLRGIGHKPDDMMVTL